MNRTDDSITQLSTLYERLGAVAHDWGLRANDVKNNAKDVIHCLN